MIRLIAVSLVLGLFGLVALGCISQDAEDARVQTPSGEVLAQMLRNRLTDGSWYEAVQLCRDGEVEFQQYPELPADWALLAPACAAVYELRIAGALRLLAEVAPPKPNAIPGLEELLDELEATP